MQPSAAVCISAISSRVRYLACSIFGQTNVQRVRTLHLHAAACLR